MNDKTKSMTFTEWWKTQTSYIYGERDTAADAWTAAQAASADEIARLKAALEKIDEIKCTCGNSFQLGNCGCYKEAEFIAREALTAAYGKPKADGELPSAMVEDK